MQTYYADLVMVFNHSLKDKVEKFIANHSFKELMSLSQENNEICLIINELKTNDMTDWLNKLVQILDDENHKEFYQLSDKAILHLYLSAKSRNDEFELKLSAEHLLLFWQLGVIIDVDYGINFDHTI